MLTKQQLQQEVKNLETKLQEFREQLNNIKEITIENASVGDVLNDGSIVVKKENGLALLIAPKSTEVIAPWSKEFSEVFVALKSQGFNPSQWFVPTQEQLLLAFRNTPGKFSSTSYWSSTELNATGAFALNFNSGNMNNRNKAIILYVRAFRCVTY